MSVLFDARKLSFDLAASLAASCSHLALLARLMIKISGSNFHKHKLRLPRLNLDETNKNSSCDFTTGEIIYLSGFVHVGLVLQYMS